MLSKRYVELKLSWIVCLTSQLTIFQSYMWRNIDVQADWRRSMTYGRAPNAIEVDRTTWLHVPSGLTGPPAVTLTKKLKIK